MQRGRHLSVLYANWNGSWGLGVVEVVWKHLGTAAGPRAVEDVCWTSPTPLGLQDPARVPLPSGGSSWEGPSPHFPFPLSCPPSRVNGDGSASGLWNIRSQSSASCCSASSDETSRIIKTSNNNKQNNNKTSNKPQMYMFFPCQINGKTFIEQLNRKAGVKREHQWD